jgi:hypothetical protein
MMHKSKRSITTLITAAVTAVIAGLPSLAVARHRHFVRQFETYASVPCDPMPACASPYAVFSAGTYVGSDPDPRMRAMLLSDFNRGVNATRGR